MENIENTIEEKIDEKTIIEEKEVKKEDDKSFIKERIERRENQILKKLGLNDFEEVEKKLKETVTLTERLNALEEQLQNEKLQNLRKDKVLKLKNILDKENVFDSEALINYVDIDKVEVGEDGNIKETDQILEELKKTKPKFFSVTKFEGESHTKSQVSKEKTIRETKNPAEALAKYLKTIRS